MRKRGTLFSLEISGFSPQSPGITLSQRTQGSYSFFLVSGSKYFCYHGPLLLYICPLATWIFCSSFLFVFFLWIHLFSFIYLTAAAAKSLQSCPTLCDPIDGSPPGSAVPGILQARTLEWVAISFSSAWKWKVKVKSLRCVRLSATPWTAAHQAPLSMGFSRQKSTGVGCHS